MSDSHSRHVLYACTTQGATPAVSKGLMVGLGSVGAGSPTGEAALAWEDSKWLTMSSYQRVTKSSKLSPELRVVIVLHVVFVGVLVSGIGAAAA